MKPSEILHRDDSSDGFLEWVSGLIVVQRTHAEWMQTLQTQRSIDFQLAQLKRTLMHETFHFYQIVCTGWLYRFAAELSVAVSALIESAGNDAARARRLVEGKRRIDAPQLGALVGALDRADSSGMTVRAIVESAAYLFEFQTEYPEFGAHAFAEQRELEGLPGEYTAGYDRLRARLGDDGAFDLLLPTAAAALCFEDPPAAFDRAIERLSQNASALPGDMLALVRWIVSQVMPDCAVIGSGMEVAEQRDRQKLRQHAIYLPAMLRLNDEACDVSPIALITDSRLLSTNPDDYLQPVLLRGGVLWLPERLNVSGHDFRQSAPLQSLLAAFAIQIQDRLHLPRPRAAISREN